MDRSNEVPYQDRKDKNSQTVSDFNINVKVLIPYRRLEKYGDQKKITASN